MAEFATKDDLAARLGIDLTAGEQTRAGTLLKQASGLIQDSTGQTIEEVKGDSLTRPGQEDRRLRLPQRPVTGVASVTLEGEAVDPDSYHLEGDVLVRDEFLRDRLAPGWGHPSETLVVTYTHGYSAIPETVKTICVEAVVRAWVNPGAVSSTNYGGEQTEYGQERGLLLTDSELLSLNRVLAPRGPRSLGLK